jgi:hypothetical protein
MRQPVRESRFEPFAAKLIAGKPDPFEHCAQLLLLIREGESITLRLLKSQNLCCFERSHRTRFSGTK